MEITNELYNSCKGTIYKACRKAFRSHPEIEFDELLSNANMIFCNAARSFDESKGAKFNSWLTTQLQRMSDVIASETRGYSLNKEQSAKISLDKQISPESQNEIGECLTYTSATEYSRKMNELASGDEWADRIPEFERYFDKMSDDAKQVFNDILDGHLYPDAETANSMGRKAFVLSATNIGALKMYKRRYAKLGWNVNRVASARQELESMLKLYRGDKLPCKLKSSFEKVAAVALF